MELPSSYRVATFGAHEVGHSGAARDGNLTALVTAVFVAGVPMRADVLSDLSALLPIPDGRKERLEGHEAWHGGRPDHQRTVVDGAAVVLRLGSLKRSSPQCH